MAFAASVLKSTALALPAALGFLVGCASGPAHEHGVRAAVPAAVRGPAPDASYDWHGQVLVPFGVLLKSSPVPLHEVLLFHDAAPAVATPGAAAGAATGAAAEGADAQNKDCYAIDGTPPRLVGQTPDGYLLCFDHDRLNRIESTVHLAADSAAQVFALACASWESRAVPAQPASPTAGVCEGRSGTTTFSAHLANEPGEPATLSLVLSNANP